MRRPSFHLRVVGRSWDARPQRGFLGLSLLAHAALLGVGAAAFVQGAIGERATPRFVVPVTLRPSAEAASVPRARLEPDPPPLEVDSVSLEELELWPTPERERPAPPPELTPLGRFPSLPSSWSAARLAPRRPPVEPEPPAPSAQPTPEPEPTRPAESSASAPVPPTLLEAPAPAYPGRARRLGQEGSVDCLLSVEADGSVSSVRVLRSSGFEALDDAARRALVRWRFLPGLRLGRPDAFEVPHRVTFVLE